jgi:peptide/nickel transport system permease protein
LKLIRYIARRILLLVPMLLGITLVVFILTRVVIHGDPISEMVPPMASAAVRARVAREMGLNQPLLVQYFWYIGNLLHGNLGVSFTTSHPVLQDLASFFSATFELTTYAMILALVAGIALGVLAAVRRNTWIDHVTRFFSVTGVAMPVFWLSLVALYLLFLRWHLIAAPTGRLSPSLTPPRTITGLYVVDSLLTGNWRDLWSSLGQLLLPTLVLAFGAMAPIARMTRAGMLEALAAQYTTAAWALGLPPRRIVLRYALKNALLPVVTMAAVVYGYLLGGSVLVENIFAWPGLGRYAYNAIAGSDYPAVQGFILYAATMYALIFLLTDVIYRWLDPRIE